MATQIGWYIDLGTNAGGTVGWRLVSDPSAAFGIVTFATTLPENSDPCSPSGSSRIYAVNFGTGKSAFKSNDLFVNYVSADAGVVTDVRFFSVDGVPRHISGDDKGNIWKNDGDFGGAGSLRRMNWREMPVTN